MLRRQAKNELLEGSPTEKGVLVKANMCGLFRSVVPLDTGSKT